MIKLFDCTLRDGGWVNDFQFGKESMCNILSALSVGNVEFIELGYLDENSGSKSDRSMYADMDAIYHNYEDMQGKDNSIKKIVMIDYGKFSIDKIPVKTSQHDEIDGIRLCFHKKDWKETVAFGKQILEKGYMLFMQPMVATRYSDEDMIHFIHYMNKELKGMYALYIVDSFGCMEGEELCHRLDIVNQYLEEGIHIGIHLHNNRNLAFRNSIAAINWYVTNQINRDLIVDESLMGFGKGSGNLIFEEIAAYLNTHYEKAYDMKEIQELIDALILPMKEQFSWGYAPIYELSAKYRATSSYAKMICEGAGFTMEELEEFLIQLPEEKKDSCDRGYVADYIALKKKMEN
ncbi:MAG: hypothetical protein ACI4F4_02060 [Lachnospiraceae bacterium]